MIKRRAMRMLFIIGALMIFSHETYPQAENVPAVHPVYNFLKRMELKGVIERYHDAVIPLSRKEIARFLTVTKEHETSLTATEKRILQDYLVEFQYDISGSLEESHRLIQSRDSTVGDIVKGYFSDKEKYLYTLADTNVSLFVDGLLTIDSRRSTGDALGAANASFVQFGGRVRGTVYDHVGYYLQATNALVYGSKNVLRRDKYISQAYTLNVGDASNFDFAEGYVRYQDDILSVQVGRERLVWGNGYGDKLIASDNPRVFDFIRADAKYKSFKYTFLHAWLLGKRSIDTFSLGSDPSFNFYEPVDADKYFAAHRFEFSFPSVVDVGFQEMAIYSNRSPDLGYLNPLTLIESTQRSRDERDNILWAFDAQAHFLKGFEFHGTVLFDDINFPKWGTNSVQNKNAYQLGMMAVDLLGFSNSSVMVEYTRTDPFTYSHSRSRDNDYGSLGRILGHHIGPNADSWFFRLDYAFNHRFLASVRLEVQREGNNIYGVVADTLVKNVGGDFLQPHRQSKDPDSKEFLGGDFVKTYRVQALATYEIINEIFLDFRYELARRNASVGAINTTDHDFGLALRVDF